ncbi:restriction endonuclease subunit S [Sediminibacterium ginsengisoli]|uniref:Type I restriction modification DNA specificity domain-containing protein n=1 Tax=Sediminibacterium ginsengisoli TaxID=413434 RepID=A0A1T4QC36_9BACT|nr:restriction endonuclease subunit S [Sediminibacterium ginsengisoli]SKA01234.1 Type I restriction modification DNA specificity domain-containing protein [Sediminibacterium ginsengisoli]
MASRGDINKDNLQPKLFKDWPTVPLFDTLEKAGSFTKLKSNDYLENGLFPVIDQGESDVAGYVDNESLIYKGSLPVIVFGDHTRNIKYVDVKFAVGADGVKILRPSSLLDFKFFFYYLKSLKIPSLGYSRHYSLLKTVEVPIPSSSEQRRIADKLDNLYLHLDSLNERLDKIPSLLKQFRENVLMQAVTGKLTEEWRRNKDLILDFNNDDEEEMREVNISLPDSWKWLPFSSIASVDSNLVEPSKFLDYPLIAPDNIQSETGRLIDKPTVSDIMPKSAKHYFEKGSILYSKIRPYLSKVIVADFPGLCSADMYPISTKLNTRYLYYYMLSKAFLSYATSAGERSVLPKINQKELSIIPISVPSLVEQNEVVRRIDTLFKSIESLEKLYANVKTKINNLPPNILAKAFSGELVDADPTDEPAAKLLERILQGQTPIKDKPQDNPRVIQSNTKRVQNKHIRMAEISLLTIIENTFQDQDFSFEELNDSLQQLSKSNYVQLKKQFFELLRNDKYKRKADRITTTIDTPSGTMRYKLQKHETIKA